MAVAVMEALMIFIVSCLCVFFILRLIKFFNKVWWNPIRIQSAMRAQGMKGPPYRFLDASLSSNSYRLAKQSKGGGASNIWPAKSMSDQLVFNLTREVKREVKLGKLIVPAKMTICLSVLALHNNPQIWGEDAHLFKPERFAGGVAEATKNNAAAFLPFGMGPRSCVGLNFALSEIKIALSMILQHYRFTLSPSYVHSPEHILTISPRYGLQILFEAL